MNKSPEIKFCPWCKKVPNRIYSKTIDKWYIACENPKCLIQPVTPAYKCKGKEIVCWNSWMRDLEIIQKQKTN